MRGRLGRVLLLLCGLCGLGVALPAPGGHCSGELCAFRHPADYKGAQKVCGDMLGQLFTFRSERDLKVLRKVLSGSGGKLWIQNGEEPGGDGDGHCSAASPRTGRDAELLYGPCEDELGGFVCQYDSGQVCSGLGEAAGAVVNYVTTTGFSLDGSDAFPPGTVAVTQRPDGEHPDQKNLCYTSTWFLAPWNCDVLDGGCEHGCDKDTNSCKCPEGRVLHPNRVSCVAAPTAEPQCPPGRFVRAPDGKGCVDVDECAEENPCSGVGEECVNNDGGFECVCADGFDWEDGACVNVSICSLCEHMLCPKRDGVYQCACMGGFKVSPVDPTKCVWNCTERDCPATCDPNRPQCFCPEGYVVDTRNDTSYFCTDIDECEAQMCDHKCVNLFGGYRCACEEGFELQDEYKCVATKPEDGDELEEASGSEYPTQSTVTAGGLQPASLPQYIKTGSILGITVFMLLCLVLLALVARNAVRRCGKFEISTFKHPDLDIYYLQQVSTETYKRLSLDRQLKHDCQRL